jgi:plastocyanin
VITSGTPAVVILERRDAGQVPEPANTPVMDQVARSFIPPILFVRTGQAAEFRNSDDELHNINVKDGVTHQQAFNVAVPTGGQYLFTFKGTGVYDVSCDIHAGMSAQIVATSTPYATLADPEGRFTFPDVVRGNYALTVYAGAQTIERTIEVAGPRTEVDATGR